jgi:CarboxypepD_reg-like domain/TonB-dependent Receptor Plug Domain
VAKTLVLVLISLFSSQLIFAQTGKISGKVLNNKNEAIPGVSVKIVGAPGGVTTDVEGRYTLTLSIDKKYELEFTAVGYQAKSISDIELSASQVNELNVVLEPADKSLGTVTVTATRSTARRETVNSIIQFQRNTNTVASVISAESIRRSPDRTTGEVLKRIPGASIQEGRFLVIRGLADRYNLAMLNGIPLSSTEPDRKTFSFDLIPSAMIDNIVINKAFVPEMPGDWAGGLVQINTVDIPTSNFFNIQLGFGFNTQTISNDFYTYKGGNLDWLGIEDGTRKLPSLYTTKTNFNGSTQAQKNAIGLAMQNVWSANKIASPLNTAFQVNGGFRGTFLGKRIGGAFGVTYARGSRYVAQQNNQYAFNSSGPGIDYEFGDDRYNQDVLLGALGSLTLELNKNNKIAYKTLFNVSGNDYVIMRHGTENFGSASLDSVRARELGFQQNTFWSNQLTGEHNITGIKTRLRWYGSFNVLDGYTPDQRRIFYRKDNSASTGNYQMLISDVLSQRSANRFNQMLNDYVYTAGGDLSRSFNVLGQSQTVKGGYMLQVRDRLFDAKPFSIALVGDNPALKALEAEQAFVPENFTDNYEGGQFYFDAIQGNRFRYLANTILNAAYIQFDNQFGKNFRLVWGVRMEDYDQLVGSVKKSDPRHVHSQVRDWLPGLNATYKLNSKTNLRFSASQTVVRPEFRELAPFEFYDFELNAAVTGKSDLQRTKVTNADLRYELYPRAGETFNVGVFYKFFEKPIEQLFFQGGGGASFFPFANPESAETVGAEVELRKRLDLIGMPNFTFQANLAYIRSRIKDDSLKKAGFSIDRPMQGQSPYVINASLMYDHEKSGLTATLLFNQIGRRIYLVGNVLQQVPDVWEASRPLLDLQIAKKIIRSKGEIRLNLQDLLNRKLVFYQNANEDEGYDKNVDPIRFSRKFGTNVGISFKYNF